MLAAAARAFGGVGQGHAESILPAGFDFRLNIIAHGQHGRDHVLAELRPDSLRAIT